MEYVEEFAITGPDVRCGMIMGLVVTALMKMTAKFEQKHKSNYNRLHLLIDLLHILRSISTDFSLLQE